MVNVSGLFACPNASNAHDPRFYGGQPLLATTWHRRSEAQIRNMTFGLAAREVARRHRGGANPDLQPHWPVRAVHGGSVTAYCGIVTAKSGS